MKFNFNIRIICKVCQAKILVLPIIILFAFSACAEKQSPSPEIENDTTVSRTSSSTVVKEGIPGSVTVNTVTVTAKIITIDITNRKVTILSPEGEDVTVRVVPEAVNFDQLRVGDLINITLTEEKVVYIDKEDSSVPDRQSIGVMLASKGAQPGGIVAETLKVTATVKSIDPINRKATLLFQDGVIKTFPVRDDIDLSQHKIGEKVVFVVVETIALSIEKP